ALPANHANLRQNQFRVFGVFRGHKFYLRFPLARAFFGLIFTDFLTGRFATFFPLALRAAATGFLAAFTVSAFFAVLFAVFFATFFFAAFFTGWAGFFFVGLPATRIGALAVGGTARASDSSAGLASIVSASRQPWASRTAIMADRMSFQV